MGRSNSYRIVYRDISNGNIFQTMKSDKKTKEFTREAFVQFGKAGSDKRWAKRLLMIEQLREFGGVQANYRLWKTKQLETLLKAWQKNVN